MRGLFDQILQAIDDPNAQASSGQLSGILGTVQQLSSSYNTSPSTLQTALSVLGPHVRSALQAKQTSGGVGQAQEIVNQYGGTTPNIQAVQSLFSPRQQQQVVNDTAQRTGLNSQTIQAMLPILIPIVLSLLQSGTNSRDPRSSNSVLSAFLDSNRDGNTDIGDVMRLAGSFLNQRQ